MTIGQSYATANIVGGENNSDRFRDFLPNFWATLVNLLTQVLSHSTKTRVTFAAKETASFSMYIISGSDLRQ